MQDGDALQCAQLDQSRLQLSRFLDRFVHEAFDHIFAPRLQSPIAESTCETLDTSKANIKRFVGIAIQYVNAGILQQTPNFGLFSRLIVVVAQHANCRNADRRVQFLGN